MRLAVPDLGTGHRALKVGRRASSCSFFLPPGRGRVATKTSALPAGSPGTFARVDPK
jgi:hypothetical protein